MGTGQAARTLGGWKLLCEPHWFQCRASADPGAELDLAQGPLPPWPPGVGWAWLLSYRGKQRHRKMASLSTEAQAVTWMPHWGLTLCTYSWSWAPTGAAGPPLGAHRAVSSHVSVPGYTRRWENTDRPPAASPGSPAASGVSIRRPRPWHRLEWSLLCSPWAVEATVSRSPKCAGSSRLAQCRNAELRLLGGRDSGREPAGGDAGGDAGQPIGVLCCVRLMARGFWPGPAGYCRFLIILLCKFLVESAECGGQLCSCCEV